MIGEGRGDWMMIEKVGARLVVLCTGSSGTQVVDNLIVVRGAEMVVG